MNTPRELSCPHHSGHEARIKIIEDSMKSSWKAIDKMTGWVIAGMGSVILGICIVILQTVILKGHP